MNIDYSAGKLDIPNCEMARTLCSEAEEVDCNPSELGGGKLVAHGSYTEVGASDNYYSCNQVVVDDTD